MGIASLQFEGGFVSPCKLLFFPLQMPLPSLLDMLAYFWSFTGAFPFSMQKFCPGGRIRM